MQILPPMRFRFTDPQDVEAYGDGWWIWDEPELAGLRASELIALEEAVGVKLARVMIGLHEGDTEATVEAMRVAMRRAGRKVARADFDPATILTTWEEVPGPLAEAPGEAPTPGENSSTPPATESATS